MESTADTRASTGLHQRLMDVAHAKWVNGMSYEQFLIHLPVREREAAVLGHLNQQVENGGFSQWIHNGYVVGATFLHHALWKVGTPEARRAAELVRQAEAMWERAETTPSEDVEESLDALDDRYYDVSSKLMVDCELYLGRSGE